MLNRVWVGIFYELLSVPHGEKLFVGTKDGRKSRWSEQHVTANVFRQNRMLPEMSIGEIVVSGKCCRKNLRI